ncbi:hypothetical protein PINS_up009597, partial [Pythium insidiosum]
METRMDQESSPRSASSTPAPLSTATDAHPTSTAAPTSCAPDISSELDRKCRRIAELIRGAKHLVAFTGAGISTSVGLPDYRGEGGIRTKQFERQQ